MKVLLWDGAGMVLTDKVPEPGKFACPKVQGRGTAAVTGAA